MPNKCPRAIEGSCDKCLCYDSLGDACNHNPHDPIKLKDLLTIDERVDKIESQSIAVTQQPWSNNQWDAVNQIKARILHLENKLVEHMAKSKKKTKYD